MVSALDEGKRIHSAIQAVSRLENAFLVIAGDGILRDEVDKLANKLLPGRYMRGIFAHERMPEVYRCADVFLHTTIGESFGNVYVEALSTGIPIVAHDEDITRWIMGSFASLVDTQSENAIVDAIERVIRNPPSYLNKGAVWASSRYGWKTIAGEYSRFLSDVYSRHRSVSQP
jgi:glycosyltransferase involved in cell wall biosynthesis